MIVAIIGSFSVSLVSFVLPSAMSLACARDTEVCYFNHHLHHH